jgi:hypothetical protein
LVRAADLSFALGAGRGDPRIPDGGRVSDCGEGSFVVLSADCRPLRRALPPLVWMALEEVGLDAVREDGQLVSRTSARRVAEHLRVDPLAAARALKALRNRGLVRLEPDQQPGVIRRFGLWVYVLGAVTGLTVVDASGTPASSPSLPRPRQEGFVSGRGSS